MLAFLNDGLSRMDSLKETYKRSLAVVKSSPAFYNNALDAGKVYEQSAKYARERMDVEEWLLQKRQPITRIDGFKPSVVPSSTSMIQYIISYTVIFFSIGCLAGGIYEISKR